MNIIAKSDEKYLVKNTIYRARLNNDGRVYIGQTWNFKKRKYDHEKAITRCKKFNLAMKKYGKESFSWSILCEVWTQEEADTWEDFFISKYYNSTNRKKGFNLKGGGSNGKHCKATKNKISKGNKGKIFSEETKQKMKASAKNKIFTQQHRDKITASLKLRIFSEEHKKRITKSMLNSKHPKCLHMTKSEKEYILINRKNGIHMKTISKLFELNYNKKISLATLYRVIKTN